MKWLPKQFSLRFLFVLMTVACVAVGYYAWEARQAAERKAAVERIREMFPGVNIDWEGWHRVTLVFFNHDATFSGDEAQRREFFSLVAKFPDLRWLWLPARMADAEGLRTIVHLRKLEIIHLHDSPVTDDDLFHLRNMTRLNTIYMMNTQVKGPGLRHLKNLKKLELLGLNKTPITDEGLAHLPELPSLETIWLQQTGTTKAGVVHVAKIPKLKSLDLRNCPAIDDDALAPLETCTTIVELDLTKTPVTGEFLRHIRGCQKLSTVYLNHTQLEDQFVDEFSHFGNLSELWLEGTSITDKGVAATKWPASISEIHLPATVGDEGVQRIAECCPNLSYWPTGRTLSPETMKKVSEILDRN